MAGVNIRRFIIRRRAGRVLRQVKSGAECICISPPARHRFLHRRQRGTAFCIAANAAPLFASPLTRHRFLHRR